METETLKEINLANDWKKAIHTAINSIAEFKTYAESLGYTAQILNAIDEENLYPFFLPRDLAQHILKLGASSLLWKQFIPHNVELDVQQLGLEDPIGDQKNFVAPQLIHRYQSRVLFLPTSFCPVQCRYCFRKNELHNPEFKQDFLHNDFQKTLSYLKAHTELEEIIFTGGDPLILSNEKITMYLEHFAQIPHVKFIRFHTRFPSIIPQRIDSGFAALIEKWSERFTLSLMIHTNHLTEWYSQQHLSALEKLAKLPLHLGSQTVLLKGHTSEDLISLFKFLIQKGVRPYYLHHPDKVKGAMHFYLSKTDGLEIYNQLRQYLPGYAIPHYVVDSEFGEEKKLVHTS